MAGYIRLSLAILVLLSHAGVTINGLNPGVIAVVIFYMLAGGVVTHLWQNILPQGKGQLLNFYKDRMLRIFPLYLYMLGLTIAFLLLTGYANPQFQVTTMLNNLLVIPLNYYMFIDNSILQSPSWWLIPQAWSLGAELQAYIIMPVVLIYKRAKMPVLIISFAIYTAANLNIINTDIYGYRLLPGVLFIFLIGSLLKEEQRTKASQSNMLFAVIVITYGLFNYLNMLQHSYTHETLLGLLIGMPLLRLIRHLPPNGPFNKLAASLSYGVFLSHFLVIWCLDYSEITTRGSVGYFALLIGVSIGIAYSGIMLVERKTKAIRGGVVVIKNN